MKLYAIPIVITTALSILSSKSEARQNLQGSALKKNRRLTDSTIDVAFNGIRIHDIPAVVVGDEEGNEEEWDLEFDIEAFELDVTNMEFHRIERDSDTQTVVVSERDMDDLTAIDGELALEFDELLWNSEDIRLYKLTVSGTELDESIDENSPDDPLPSCSTVINYVGGGRTIRDSILCEGVTHSFTVYFRVDED